MIECSTVTVLIDEIEIVGGFEHVEIADDVFVDFDVGEDVDFIDGAFFEFFVLSEFGNWDDFDGVFFLVFVVYGAVDFAVDSGTDLFVEGVVFNVLWHGV